MAVLVIAEHDNASIKGATLNTVTAATQCGGDVHVLVAGHNAAGAAQAAAQIQGVAKVLHADGASLAEQLAEGRRRGLRARELTGLYAPGRHLVQGALHLRLDGAHLRQDLGDIRSFDHRALLPAADPARSAPGMPRSSGRATGN